MKKTEEERSLKELKKYLEWITEELARTEEYRKFLIRKSRYKNDPRIGQHIEYEKIMAEDYIEELKKRRKMIKKKIEDKKVMEREDKNGI